MCQPITLIVWDTHLKLLCIYCIHVSPNMCAYHTSIRTRMYLIVSGTSVVVFWRCCSVEVEFLEAKQFILHILLLLQSIKPCFPVDMQPLIGFLAQAWYKSSKSFQGDSGALLCPTIAWSSICINYIQLYHIHMLVMLWWPAYFSHQGSTVQVTENAQQRAPRWTKMDQDGPSI